MEEQPDTTQSPPAETAAERQPPKRSTRRKVIIGMSIALAVLLVAAGLMGGLYAWRFHKAANDLTIEDVDMSRLPDGTYQGSYSVFHVKAAVEVSVEDGRVVAIGLVDSGRMAEETQQEVQEIFDEVISAQSLEVDITSGASVSKKVSLKAVEDALGGGD